MVGSFDENEFPTFDFLFLGIARVSFEVKNFYKSW